MKLIVSRAVYIPFGSNHSSNRGYPWWGLWKTSGPQSYPVTTERICSRWTHQNVYAHATLFQIEILDCDDGIRSAPHYGPNRDNPVQTYLIVSEGETRSWQIVSSEIEQSWSYRIQRQQIISERIDLHYFVLKPKISRKSHDQLRMNNRGVHNESQDSGNAALRNVKCINYLPINNLLVWKQTFGKYGAKNVLCF